MAGIEDFDTAHTEKLKTLSREDRLRANLRKLAQDMYQRGIKEPKGLASGKTDKSGSMIIDLDEDFEGER